MDQLSQKEQEKIRKMSDKRVGSLLIQAGVDPDELETMDRNSMIDRWAQLVAAGDDKGGATAVKTATMGYDVELQRSKLAFEQERLAFENKRLETEKAERNRLVQFEMEKLAFENRKLDAEKAERDRQFEKEKFERDRQFLIDQERSAREDQFR